MTIKVESGIPIETVWQTHDGNRTRKYPFNEMKVGDSFLCNGFDPRNVRLAAISYGRAYERGQKFSVRKTPEGFRCWRIK